MDSALLTIGLPIPLAVVIMFGLGLSLTPADFRRVRQSPGAVGIALACQLLILPLVAFGLVKLFDLPPLLAVGFMILAASGWDGVLRDAGKPRAVSQGIR